MLENRPRTYRNVVLGCHLGPVEGFVKRWTIFLCFFSLFFSCNKESVSDCLQNSGDIIRREIAVTDFTKITVFEKIQLILKEGPVSKVEVETGEFLIDEVSAEVEDGRLILRNENGCNVFRKYGITKIYVTAPNIDEIRSSTGFPIQSDGVLTYQNITLFSESFINETTETTDGEFDLELDSQQVNIVVNGIAHFKIRGETENLNIIIAAGDSRIETENLISENINLNHRGSNDILINPQQSIQGVIRGIGDVISMNRPVEVDVQELFRGHLIFK